MAHLKRAVGLSCFGARLRFVSQDAVVSNNDPGSRSPVVILLGWGNGSLKNLAKYASIFEAKGFTTVSVPTSLNQLFLRPFSMAFTKAKAVACVTDELTKNCRERPVFLMSFSNTGSAVYYALAKSKAVLRWNLAGTIFDSAPIVPSMKASLSAIDAITKDKPFPLSLLARMATRVLVSGQMVMNHANFKEYMHVISNCETTTPQLILFSQTDSISPYVDILNFIDARKRKGVAVVAKMWERSNHVGHFLAYRDEYENVVSSFIDMCLSLQKARDGS